MKELITRFGARGSNSLILIATMLVLLLTWQGPQSFSQTGTGEINGTVTDQTGAVVPRATVTLRNESTGVVSTASTTSKGVFHFLNVLPGTYVLKVRASGFKVASFSPFVVGVSQLVTKNAELMVGAVSQAVEVEAHAPLLQASSTELGSVLTERSVQDLPLNGRNFMEFLLLQPGATPITTAQGGQGGGGNPDGGIIAIPGAKVARPSFQGSQGRSVIYYTDGIINTDFRSNEPGVPPNPDLIQEFDVVTHDARADFGGVTGAAVNLVTKSGTNQIHGSAFEFVRNNIFNARDTFVAGPLPAFHQNQFGAAAGGPIRKNKTFIYGGYSGWRYLTPSTHQGEVPLTSWLDGDFSSNPFGDVNPIFNPYSTQADPNNPGSYIRSPFTCDGAGNPIAPNPDGTQTGGTPCEKIPSQLISPAMQDMLKTYDDSPTRQFPCDPTKYNFCLNGRAYNNENDMSVRVDNVLTNRDNVFFRYSEVWETALSSSTPKSSSSTQFHDINLGGGWTHTFSPTLVLNARGGWLHGPVDSYDQNTAGVTPQQKYFNDLDSFGSLLTGSIGHGADFIPYRDNFRNNPGWNYTVNLSWFKGSHNFQFGYAYLRTIRIQQNKFEQFFFNSSQTCNPENCGSTGDALASALLGFPDSFQGQLIDHSEVHLINPEWAIYAQDQWKLRPKLTINWGLRWDVNPLATIVGPRVSDAVDIFHQKFIVGLDGAPPLCSQSPNSNPCMPQDLTSIPGNQYISFGGNKLQVPRAEYDQIGPRFGVAWQMTPTMVLRGGYGLYFDAVVARTQAAQNDLEQLAWPYTTGFSGVSNVPTSGGVPAGGTGNSLVPITSIEGSFPNPVPAATPWTPHGWADDPNIKDPYAHEWNIELQRQFGSSTMLSVAYVGSAARRLPYTGPNANAASHPSPAGTPLTTIDSLRAFPTLQGAYLYYTQGIGYGNFNALEAKLVRHFSGGLQSQLAFTWGKSLDNSSGYFDVENGAGSRTGVQNFFDPRSNYSLSGYDVPLDVNWYTVYDLPLGHGKRWLNKGVGAWVLGDWQVNYIMQAYSGQPYTLGVQGGDIANIFGTNTAGVRDYERPNQIGDPLSGVPTGYEFNASAYAIPGTGTYGNVGRNSLRSPAVFDMDFSVFKNIPLGHSETRRLQLRFEGFNVFNVMNWSTPHNTTIGTSNAGFVNSIAVAPRSLQFGARIIF